MEERFKIKEALEELNETELEQVYTMANMMAQKHRQDTKKALLSLADLYEELDQRGNTSEVEAAWDAFEQKLEGLPLDIGVTNELSDLAITMSVAYGEQGFALGFRQAAALLMGGQDGSKI